MKLEYLEEFLTLAETGSYGTAAESMFISVSTLSRHIMLLEEELGAELLHRGPRTVSLTKAGSMLIPYAKTITEAKSEYVEKLAAEQGSAKQMLAVGFARSIIQYGLMDKLIQFRDANPDLTVLISEGSPSTRLQMIKNNECDFILGFNYSFFDSPDIQCVPLIRDHFCVAMPSNHPLAGEEAIDLHQVKDENFIFNLKGGPGYKQAMQLFQNAGLKPHVLTHVESSRFIVELVSLGVGLALVEKLRFQNSLPSGVTLVDLKPEEEQIMGIFYKKREFCEAEKRFLDFMKKEARF